MKNNYPCRCGHPKNMHVKEWDWADGASACFVSENSPDYHLCSYIPDNLLYLEAEYGSHNK